MQGQGGIRPLLMGPALNDRECDSTVRRLDAHVEALLDLLPQVYGNTEACRQAKMELARVLKMPSDRDGVWCRRAALLYGVACEKELAAFLAGQEGGGAGGGRSYTEDLHERVLPFVAPRFMRNSCQAPDTFAVLCTVLAEMWPGEPLGNWPRGAPLSGPC